MKRRPFWILAAVLVTLFLVIGCSSSGKHMKGPKWVWKGSGAFDEDEGKVFYGVGIAAGIKNRALLRATADNRARVEVAKVLETYVAALAKDYMASTTAGDMSASSEEQHVEQALKSFTKATLHGATIVDHWVDPDDGTMFSLCKLNLAAFKETLDNYRELDSKVRDFVRQNAERLHSELRDMERQSP